MKKKHKLFGQNWGLLLLSLLLFGAGTLLLLYPTESMKTLCYITASTTTLVGIVLCLFAISFKERRGKFLVFILSGAMSLVAGITLFFVQETVLLFYTALIGLLLLLNGGFILQRVLLFGNLKTPLQLIKTVFSLLVIFGGFLCIRMQSLAADRLALLLGLTLVVTGVLDFLSFFSPLSLVEDTQPKEETAATFPAK